jgi:uncharacterized membrane protein YdjX (TVP38/TMEM64 family)
MFSPKTLWLAATGLILIAGAVIALLLFDPELVQRVWALKDLALGWCRDYPVILFSALVFLPAFGCPASVLLILAGATWGSNWQSCTWALLALSLNMTWTYFASAGPARKLVIGMLGDRWTRWENMEQADLVRLTVLMRVTPGVPLFFQNYALGLLAVPYLPYILVSVPISGIFAVGFVLTGGAIFKGQLGLAITGIAVLVAAVLLVRMLRSRMNPSNKTAEI